MLLPSEIRRMAEPEDDAPKLTQEELDAQVAEFLAKGGKISKHEPGESAIDFAKKFKPGEVYGKRAY